MRDLKICYNHHMKNFITSILDLIYRKKCYFCGKSKSSLKMCPECYEELTFSEFHANRIIDGVNIYSCGIYEKYLQKLIRGLKYHKQRIWLIIWLNLCGNIFRILAWREFFKSFRLRCTKTESKSANTIIWCLWRKNFAKCQDSP